MFLFISSSDSFKEKSSRPDNMYSKYSSFSRFLLILSHLAVKLLKNRRGRIKIGYEC